MKPKTVFPVVWVLLFLMAACAQAARPSADPTDNLQSGDPPPIPAVDTPTPAYPAPDEPVVMPTDGKQDQPAGYAPRSGDERLNRGNVFVEASDILIMESYPLQFMLHLSGNLPTPCHELRAVAPGPDEDGRIDVELYSVSDPDLLCAQVLSPFEANIPLGSYTDGSYPVTINGELQVGVIEP